MRALRSSILFGVAIALSLTSPLSCGGDDEAPPAPTRYDVVPSDKTVEIANLTSPVDVVRDKYGMVHIRAKTAEDALRVEGYQVARDRTVQLELIRRSATGRLAELFGDNIKSLIDSDIAMRTIGLARTAKAMVDLATPEERRLLDAFADGVSQFNARALSGEVELAGGMIGLSQTAFQPWTAVDVLAIARLQALNLAYSADEEIAQTDFVEAARTKLSPTAVDPALAKRAGLLFDLVRFAPIENVSPLTAFPNDTQLTLSTTSATKHPSGTTHPTATIPPVRSHRVDRAGLSAAKHFIEGIEAARKIVGDRKGGFTGSNNWVVGPSRTSTGHAMLASDPHLTLSAPAVFWMVQVSVDSDNPVDRLDFAGLAFPGLPSVILGFNANVAWGATTADYDVTDVYEEKLTPDGSGVVFRGQPVPFQKVRETIKIVNSPPLEYDVLIVPHHGPVVPTITADHKILPVSGDKALSVRWTGHTPTKDITAVFGMVKSKSVDDARASLRSFAIGAENWVVADTAGNIFYTTQSDIPKRDKGAFTWDPATFTGTIPCFVLPGDGSAEWSGKLLEESFIPHVKNPPKAYVATSNTEQIGTTFDNDPTNDTLPNGEPMYMGAWHDVGFRLARVQQRIEAAPKMTPEEMASIQGDARSAMGSKLAASIITALDHAAEEVATPGSHKDLTALVATDGYKGAASAEMKDLLTRWGTEADYLAASGMKNDDNQPNPDPKEAMASRATMLFNAWLSRMVQNVLADEVTTIGAGFPFDSRKALLDLMLPTPSSLKTFDGAMNDSILFDNLSTPAIIESRDERILTSLIEAIAFLRTRLGPDSAQWQWGRLHTIRFTSLVSLWKTLSIPADPDATFPLGFPRHGDGYNVDVAGYPLPITLDASTSFSYSHGPTQRFVIDMDPAGVVARNALPGGNVWDSRDPHFSDEAERWRRNETRPIPFRAADVIADAESRIVYRTP